MELPIFKLAADCDRCVFGETAQSIGIPTRHIAGTGHDTALLIVGDKPGVEEDAAYAHFVGNAGQILQEVYVEAGELSKYADVYATNAVRCKPPKDIEPRVTQYKACRPHLDDDIYELSKRYPRVVVLGVGAGAARALRGSSLEDATFAQGIEISFGDNTRRVCCPAFWTDNPANLFTHRNPTRVDAVADHLQLLGDFLRTGSLPNAEIGNVAIEVAARELGIPTSPISFDIESYGCIAGLPNQRVFNAKRAIATDEVQPDKLVATIALSWRDKDRLRSSVYVASNPEHVEAFGFAISDAINRGCWLLGMNTAFDVGFLRADPRFSQLFTRGKCKLLDLAVYNYLDSEVRMERSLKNISPLKGTTTYDDEEINLKKGERYDSDADPRLHKYNAKDAIATLINYEKMLASIANTYGPDSDKLSERTRQWYNELLWFAIESGEDGVYIDREQLVRVDAEMKRRADRVERWVKASGGSINGTGSGKWKSTLSVEAATEAGLLNDPRLARTKTGISANNANFELYLGCLDRKSPLSRKVRAIQLFTQFRDIRSRYTNAMLVGRKVKGYKGLHPGSLVLDTGLVHPTWYIIPGQFEDNSRGGTKQGRITCLHGDTSVITSEGDLPIREAVRRKLEVITFDRRDGTLRFVIPAYWIHGGIQPLLKVTYKGRNSFGEVLCSPEHRWLKKNGDFIEAKNLRKGMSLRHVYRFVDHHGYPRLRSRDRKWPEQQHTIHTLNLPGHEIVHHLDENRSNFARSNLQGMDRVTHTALHHTGKGEPPVTYTCENCGALRTVGASRDYSFRFCCRNCFVEFSRNNYRVCSIEPAGVGEVFCFQIPETETFLLSDGLVSGNCRNPGLQNLAKPVKACLSTRYDLLLEADLSQIELRTAALISGDPVMCGDYNAGRDRHLTTARVILREVLAYMITNKRDSAFGFDRASIEFLALDPSVTKKTHGIDIWRHLGKTLNFLVLFRGGAKKAQETAQRDLGVLLPLDVWTRIIVSFYRECHVFGRWQAGWIADAKKHGRCVLPLLGQSRLFHGGVSGVEKAMNEVANFPIQTMAANALIDGQRLCRARFREAGLRAVSSLSIYDAMYVECPQDELETVKSIIDDSLRNIPYWLDLQRHYGRKVPVGYDIKILRTRNVNKP